MSSQRDAFSFDSGKLSAGSAKTYLQDKVKEVIWAVSRATLNFTLVKVNSESGGIRFVPISVRKVSIFKPGFEGK